MDFLHIRSGLFTPSTYGHARGCANLYTLHARMWYAHSHGLLLPPPPPARHSSLLRGTGGRDLFVHKVRGTLTP